MNGHEKRPILKELLDIQKVRTLIDLFGPWQGACPSNYVQAAFLQGKKITRDVFIIPPKEVETRKIWKLNKCIYGLVDGPIIWYVELRDTLLKLKVVISSYDESFMIWYNEDKLEGIIAVLVDDLMFGGSKKFEKGVIGELKK